jgi:DNA polymerase III delta prime subunit
MRMKIYKSTELKETSGDMMLFYGESGVGKSVTSIQTAPAPILYIMAEGRDVSKMLKAAQRKNLEIEFAFYEGWDDMIKTINDPKNFTKYKSIIIDSLSHLMSICLANEINEENFSATDKKKDIDKPLTMQVKMSLEGFGAMSGQMLRFTNAATRLTSQGHEIICLARLEQAPKFNRALQAAPALSGRDYPKHMQGFFDFIGLVESHVGESGRVEYPPLVSFESDGSFMAKWTGIMPEGGVRHKVMNIERILEVAHYGGVREGGV